MNRVLQIIMHWHTTHDAFNWTIRIKRFYFFHAVNTQIFLSSSHILSHLDLPFNLYSNILPQLILCGSVISSHCTIVLMPLKRIYFKMIKWLSQSLFFKNKIYDVFCWIKKKYSQNLFSYLPKLTHISRTNNKIHLYNIFVKLCFSFQTVEKQKS